MSNLSGICPNCGSKLIYKDDEQSVMCYACDSLINVADFAGSKAVEGGKTVGGVAAVAMMGFDNPESGVVFLENFFETYAWKEYQADAEIEIPEISGVISNNKMKNGAVASAWYLEYKGLAVPVRKKIEGLAWIAEKIGEAYNPDDLTEAYESYDVYVNVSKRLLEEKENIFGRLECAIKYAEKFKLEKTKLSGIKADIEELKAMYDRDVYAVTDISDLPAYLAAQAALNTEKSRELAVRGIDAKAAYEEALQMYNSENPDKSGALVLLERVRGYGESVRLINNINQFYNFEGELYRFFGKYFVFKNESYVETLNVKELGKKKAKKGQEAEQTQQVAAPKAWSLYEVVDGEPSKAPIVAGITKMIACYGGKIYYFKLNQGIYSYNAYTNIETQVDAGKTSDYTMNDGSMYQYALINNGKAFLVKKRAVREMKPVEGGKKGQMVEAADITLNPESVIVVDMVNEIAKKAIPAMQKVVFPENNKKGKKLLKLNSRLFYTFVEKSIPVQAKGCGSKKKEPVVELQTKFMVCNLITGECQQVLDEKCEICTVCKDKIVYTVDKPNKYNKDILVYDMTTGESNVVESNVYEYVDVIEGKVYYRVGNEEYCPLVRNSFAGGEREEIMQNVDRIICDIGGWMYVHKGKGINSLLVKISADGKKQVVLCSQIQEFIGFFGNLIYYKDYGDTLRSVRIDGKNNIAIAKNIEEVYPLQKALFYTRKEKVGEEKEALSIYKMDKDGRNVRKLVFDVDKVGVNELDSKLYFKRNETARFKVYEPKKEKEAVLIDYPLQKYYEMDMNTEDVQLVLTVGLPHSEERKKGCGGKKTTVDKIYEKVAWTANSDCVL